MKCFLKILFGCLIFQGAYSKQSIFEAIEKGDLREVRRMIQSDPACILERDAHKRTPLMVASIEGFFKIAQELVVCSDSSINDKDNKGFTALMHAISEDWNDITRLLLKYGSDPNVETCEETPLILACQNENSIIATLLIERCVDVNKAVASGLTPLIQAAGRGALDLVDVLIKAGADVNASACEGQTALIAACCEGHREVAIRLISAGSDLEILSGEYAFTALHFAFQAGYQTLMQDLIKAGAVVLRLFEFEEFKLIGLKAPKRNAIFAKGIRLNDPFLPAYLGTLKKYLKTSNEDGLWYPADMLYQCSACVRNVDLCFYAHSHNFIQHLIFGSVK